MLLLNALGGLAMVAGVASGELTRREAVTHDIKVGRASLHLFEPAETNATVGDILRFHFYPVEHSVARAEYMFPCQPINYVTPTHAPSFWSGFHPVKEGDLPTTWEVRVNDTEAIWVYCSQIAACTKDAMVGVIWVDGNRTDASGNVLSYQDHLQATKKFSKELSPGDPAIPEGQNDVEEGAAAAPAPHPHGLSKGAIAGIAVGAAVAVIAIAVLVYLFGRNKSLSDTLRYSRPPAGKIAPLPMSEGGNGPSSPYPAAASFPASPAFPQENKMGMGVPAPGYNHGDNNGHQSWMSGAPTMRAQSPDAEQGYGNGGLMSPNAFSAHNSLSPMTPQQQQMMFQAQQQGGQYHVQSSPSETPWSPGGYNWQNMQGQQQHEMGAGQEGVALQRQSQMGTGNNGYPAQQAPVELAGDTSENMVSSAPPVYSPTLTDNGEPAQKPEDKTPAVTTREA